jgi:hypothetical protein
MSDSEQSKTDYIQHLSDEFSTLCQLRHEAGAEEYGDVAFLTAPLIRMAAEELADMSNYCRYMYIKLRMMEEYLDASGADLSAGTAEEIRGDDSVPFGAAEFISAEKIQGFLSKKE